MTVSILNIVPRKYAETTITAEYTSSGGTTIIDKVTVTNVGVANANFSCWLIANAGVAGNDNLVVNARTIAPGETYLCPELVAQVILVGGFMSIQSTLANTLTISGAGRLIT